MAKYVSKQVDENGDISWNQTENQTWNTLIERQDKIVQGRACDEFLEGLKILEFPRDRIPQITEVNEKLISMHGWGVQGVPALIQPKEFFELLSKKRFPAATFIRVPEELDYLQEPDIFHEIYGHTPLLTNQYYCEFMQEFGKLALNYSGAKRRKLFRLFWFTVEFGMIKNSDNQMRAYGSGILSSIGETQYCLTDECQKQAFDPLTTLRTPFRIDIMQPIYYYLECFSDLFKILDADIDALLKEAKELGDLEALFREKSDEIKGAMSC